MNVKRTISKLSVHLVLVAYTCLALFPIILVIMNSFKARKAIFLSPLTPPTPSTFDLIGYHRVFADGAVGNYYLNSITVTLGTIFFTLLFGAMAGWALSEYKFRFNKLIGLYLAIGIMVPIRLGSVAIISMISGLGLINTLTALICVYVAQNLPLAVFILGEFMNQIPKDLREAARCDGLSEYSIFFHIILPLLRPAMATVAVFTMIPVWNDLWFPLILAPSGGKQTITLGVQQFLGQYVTDWNSVLAALSTAIIPVLIFYILFSRQLIRGLTSGAVK
ncbi:carbohydrate ABC transporter permease [Aestuariivirga litoralis]|uniref:carbohydrate ABC transporter permease n=1 Tax=Aestuariivirga litoralis TaxID=2650924 RepID=UPI0018C7EB83|nr:carbohydrate ABC transporter permease [Aestuariivirga litoralis]MBG1233877.1 carbohydrate ABC transporter permease [Aestuariivirga litoralis]